MSQMDSYPHLVHCMDHLLQNILCEADDTPLYTIPKHNSSTGLGQKRQCRSWSKLQAWAESQSSCFSYINETQGVSAILQRFRYCPNTELGRNFDARMRKYFRLGPEWDSTPRQDIDTIPRYWDSFKGSEPGLGSNEQRLDSTHKAPRPKIPPVMNFFFRGICKFLIMGTGMLKIVMSKAKSVAPMAISMAAKFRLCGRSGVSDHSSGKGIRLNAKVYEAQSKSPPSHLGETYTSESYRPADRRGNHYVRIKPEPFDRENALVE
ncbi:MAG: hypothetical protein Q9159_002464 [Coniocarpon cinnabarinum]